MNIHDELSKFPPHVTELRQAELTARMASQKLAALQSKVDLLETELLLAKRRQDWLDQMPAPRRVKTAGKKQRPGKGGTAVVVWTDWHLGESVDPVTVNGLNEYSVEIARKRFQRSLDSLLLLLDSARRMTNIDTMVRAILGDLITGHIHDELLETNSLGPNQECQEAVDLICHGIQYIRKHAGIKEIVIPTCFGNHSRTTLKPRYATGHRNSREWLLYKSLERLHARSPAIRWKVEDGYHNYVDIAGKRVRFHHGDGLKYWGGVGGLTIPTCKAIAQWNKGRVADLDVFGHYHQFMWHRSFIACNCMIGYSAHALRIKAEYSCPSQTFFVLDPSRPSPVYVSEIYCDDSRGDSR